MWGSHKPASVWVWYRSPNGALYYVDKSSYYTTPKQNGTYVTAWECDADGNRRNACTVTQDYLLRCQYLGPSDAV